MNDNSLGLYLFHQGTNYESHKLLGCRPEVVRGTVRGAVFRVWAPNARAVSVAGDFNRWDPAVNKMDRVTENGVWEAYVPEAREFDKYKFHITAADGREFLKADPFASFSETNGKTASVVYSLSGYKWGDKKYAAKSGSVPHYGRPMNIYEVSLGSFKRHELSDDTSEDVRESGESGEPESGGYYTYRDYIDILIPYVREMNYTHIELLPVLEFPYDGSWGYQPTGFFSITSRHGTPKDFMAFVDACHQNGIGVIVDWVPAHFAKDAHGLYEFDGQPLFENQGGDRMESRDWGTRCFDFGRQEVQSFLISSVMQLLGDFHVDGIRVDAVSYMLYLDFGRRPGEWVPNVYGDNKNLEAIAFIKKLNTEVFARFPRALMIAEESTAYPLVTAPVSDGGLGFNFKWNMGWMNDMLSYMKCDPLFRQFNHDKLTFSFFYAFSENFILPISHDEVVHGKRSLISKMPGEYAQKFASVRLFLAYMIAHPGKKLNFMGNEIGQFKEWDYREGLEFFLLEYDSHRSLREYTRDINKLYMETSEFWEEDNSWNGFSWICPNDAQRNVAAFMRINRAGDAVVAVFNFSAAEITGYKLGVRESGSYHELFCSGEVKYGGSGELRKIRARRERTHDLDYTITFDMQPLSASFFRVKKTPEDKRSARKKSSGTKTAPAKARGRKSEGEKPADAEK